MLLPEAAFGPVGVFLVAGADVEGGVPRLLGEVELPGGVDGVVGGVALGLPPASCTVMDNFIPCPQ